MDHTSQANKDTSQMKSPYFYKFWWVIILTKFTIKAANESKLFFTQTRWYAQNDLV